MLNRTPLLALGCALLICCLQAHGQYFVQQGNVLDANNRVGSGGLNYGGTNAYRPNLTNRYVTGNVTGGTAFRGYSPVRDSNSFFLGSVPGTSGATGSGLLPGFGGNIGGLPSDRLTTFRRDSVSMNELRRLPVAPTLAPLPYYSQTSTVADTGQIIRGLNQPGTSQVLSSYAPLRRDTYSQPTNPLDAARNSLIGTPLSVDTRLVRADTGQTLTGPVNQRLLGSPLFGGIREVSLSALARQTDPGAAARAEQSGPRTGTSGREDPRRPGGGVGVDGQPLPRERDFGPTDVTGGAEPGTAAGLSRPIGADETATGGLARPLGPAGNEAQTSGNLRRGRMRIEDATVSTLIGTEQERMQAELEQARTAMGEQRYYDAARRFQMAQAIDLRDPTPLMGRALALLAAGDYMSSANDLFMSIEIAGPAAAVQVEWRRLMPSLESLDRRRAFLEQRLAVYEDFRLRFLLGWAQYVSGLTEPGLADMRKGAQVAPRNNEQLNQFIDGLAAHAATQPAAAATQPR